MRLKPMLVFPAGTTKACRYAAAMLRKAGIPVIDHPAPEVTHLLLDIPSFEKDGSLRGGSSVEAVLERLPQETIVIGGNLSHAALVEHQTLDLLRDETYLAANAAITADCALQVAAPIMTTTFVDSPALIIGWGRIGKCLAQLLTGIGCQVFIAARKERDRAMLQALGYSPVDISGIPTILPRIRILFNTVPELVLHKETLAPYKDCVKIDLASKPGIESDDIIWARGLPGIHAPESSGKLIAETVLRLCREGT